MRTFLHILAVLPGALVRWIARGMQVRAERRRARAHGCVLHVALSGVMAPAIDVGDFVHVEPMGAGHRPPDRGEIVAYRHVAHDGAIVFMRVAGIAGDTVELRDGELFVNDLRKDEPMAQVGNPANPYSRTFAKTTVPAGALFVLGDSRDTADDSRNRGPVPLEDVVGRAVLARSPTGAAARPLG